MATAVRRLKARLARPEPPSAEALIRSVLEPGERLLWCGRPRPYRGVASAVAGAVFVVGFGVACIACAVLTVVGLVDVVAAAFGADVGGDGVGWWQLFGAVFAAGSGRVVLAELGYLPDRTAYGLTDRNAVIVRDGTDRWLKWPAPHLGYRRAVVGGGRRRRTVERLALHAESMVVLRAGRPDVGRTARKARGDGIGTITFDDFAMRSGEDGYTPAFERIDDAAEVKRLIDATRAPVRPEPRGGRR